MKVGIVFAKDAKDAKRTASTHVSTMSYQSFVEALMQFQSKFGHAKYILSNGDNILPKLYARRAQLLYQEFPNWKTYGFDCKNCGKCAYCKQYIKRPTGNGLVRSRSDFILYFTSCSEPVVDTSKKFIVVRF